MWYFQCLYYDLEMELWFSRCELDSYTVKALYIVTFTGLTTVLG